MFKIAISVLDGAGVDYEWLGVAFARLEISLHRIEELDESKAGSFKA